MKQKTVLILEDDEVIRGTLQAGLQERGINVIAAATAGEAWRLLDHVPDLDVAVLDIMLGRGGPIDTGFDFGLRLKRERSEWPPEFLIHSAYEDVDYYQAALKLEAAAYLKKGAIDNVKLTRVEVVAQHVRALALRRGLRSPGMAERMRDIAARSESRDDAMERFCREVLSAELEATMGRNYILLLTQDKRIVPFSGRALAHASYEELQQLQSAVHARLGSVEPFIVSSGELFSRSAHEGEASQRLLLPFEEAAFIELGEIKSARLSLGLIPGEQSPESVKEQVKLLDRYLQRPVIGHLLEITEMWGELDLERRLEAQKRLVLLHATSNFCFWQSEQLGSLVREAEEEAGDERERPSVTNLRVVAAEMRDAGELLVYFGSGNELDAAGVGNVDMAALVDRIWQQDADARLHIRVPHVLRLEGHCVARISIEQAERLATQIMSWLAARLARPAGKPLPGLAKEGLPELLVGCLSPEEHDGVQIIFEEHNSRRLPAELRKSLFEPFYTQTAGGLGNVRIDGERRLGLYLAKTLAGLANGRLEDRSDELGGGLGHRFVLELPAGEEST